ncbi:MAG TPA: hypothetical protein VMD52_03215 [Patescibacteria group bacterium]|nr:hypothetical protein [Patescibacteria group bacterium]
MNPQNQTPTIKNAYTQTFRAIRSTPEFFWPFFIFAILESVFLLILFLAPREPLRLVLGPPIRTFWGERFLHYPANFLLLPKLSSLSRMFLSVFFGSLLTGTAVAMAVDVFTKGKARFDNSLKTALKKYLVLFAIILVVTVLFYLALRFSSTALVKYFIAGHRKLLFIPAALWLGPLAVIINLAVAIVIQALFTYAIPALMAENQRFITCIFRSFVAFKDLFGKTLLLVTLPILAYLPIIVLNYNAAFLIRKAFPEIILIVLLAGVFISALVVDLLITYSTAFLYLLYRNKK